MPAKQNGSEKILFRVDGNAAVGSGHVRRCLTLASELRRRGHVCLFVCRHASQSFNGLVSAAGFPLFELPDTVAFDEAVDAELVIRAVATHAPFAFAVVDHYQLAWAWERAVRAIAVQMVVIDDLADRVHDCDFLVDVAPGADDRYTALVPPTCRTFLGPAYALLRPEFRQLQSTRQTAVGPIDRLLISFGGVDATNVTEDAIAAVRQALPDVMINAVVTDMSPHREALEKLASSDVCLQIDVNVENMAEKMMASDLAIGAGGSTSWERACLGLPSIVVPVAENQLATVSALQSLGCAIAVAPGPNFITETRDLVRLLSASPELRALISAAASAAVDGRGASRIASALLPGEIMLRPATENDCRQIWAWRNAPEIRATAIDNAEIPWDRHCAWFARRLVDPQTIMLVAEEALGGVGVIRFDLDGADASVSIFLAPGNGGRSLGSIILRDGEQWVMARHPEIKRFLADVRPENAASIALFEGANYEAQRTRFERIVDGRA